MSIIIQISDHKRLRVGTKLKDNDGSILCIFEEIDQDTGKWYQGPAGYFFPNEILPCINAFSRLKKLLLLA